MHDGPGLRTTVFLKGCPLRCEWCHNPETQSGESELLYYSVKCIFCGLCEQVCPEKAHSLENGHKIDRAKCRACGVCAVKCPAAAVEICGREYSIEELLCEVEKDRMFYGENGGVTLSGGEPFLQGKIVVDFLESCKSAGMTTAVETCGYADEGVILSAIPHTDLFLWDIKDTNDVRHKKYTGVSNIKIIKNLFAADANGAKTRLRCILVSGVNTDVSHYRGIAKLAVSLKNCEGVEIMPYHAYGGSKATHLGREDNGRSEWIPSDHQINEAKEILASSGVTVW